ncbi:MAG: hypothetical protein V2A79_01670 [Planctomycetota bacterium]
MCRETPGHVFFVSFVFFLISWCGSSGVAVDCEQLLQHLRDLDAEFFAGLTLSITVTEPVHGAGVDLGSITRQGTLTVSRDGSGLILQNPRFDKTPSYKPPGAEGFQVGDYDSEGNLIVWRPKDYFMLKTDDSIETYDQSTVVFVAPSGAIARQADSAVRLARYQVSDQKGFYLYNKVLRATGRGFAQYLETIDEMETLPSGLIELHATGPYGHKASMRWTLTVDPGANYLVRSAVLGSRDNPLWVVSTTGSQEQEGVTVPLRGTVTYPFQSTKDHVSVVEFKSLSKTIHGDVVQRLKAQLSENDLPVGAYIEDYRADPTSSRPVRTLVGEKNGETK